MTTSKHEHSAYDSRCIANSFLELASEGSVPVTHMKLQKLVYITHGWHLAIYGQPLIRDEVQAWPYGPVIPVLYDEFKGFGGQPVDRFFKKFDFKDGFDWSPPMIVPLVENEEDRVLIKTIYDSYGKLSAIALSDLTHQSGSPWSRVFEQHGAGAVIGNDVIQSHFAELAQKYEQG